MLTVSAESMQWFAAPAPQPLPVSGRPSAMFKAPLRGELVFTSEGLVGDVQADRAVHGGVEKAVHVYPRAHWAALAQAFPELRVRCVPGALGENLSVAGLCESDVQLGEVWSVGGVRLQVCQPRQPCWKIDDRLQTEGVAAFIEDQGLTGWYCRVLTPGTTRVGESAARTPAADGPSLAAARALSREHRPAPDDLRGLAQTPGIAQTWARKLIKRADYLVRMV